MSLKDPLILDMIKGLAFKPGMFLLSTTMRVPLSKLISVGLAFIVGVNAQSSTAPSPVPSPAPSVWLPSSIEWVPCFEARQANYNLTFTCANLTVPMDYLDNPQNKTTQLGVAKAHPMELTEPLGELFIGQNDWASYVPLLLNLFRNILGYQTEVMLFPFVLNVTNRQYDIMLVDNRGVKAFKGPWLIVDWLVKLLGLHRKHYSSIWQSSDSSEPVIGINSRNR